jgi:hypothetical protein
MNMDARITGNWGYDHPDNFRPEFVTCKECGAEKHIDDCTPVEKVYHGRARTVYLCSSCTNTYTCVCCGCVDIDPSIERTGYCDDCIASGEVEEFKEVADEMVREFLRDLDNDSAEQLAGALVASLDMHVGQREVA